MSECKHDGGFRYMDPGPLSDDIVYKVCNQCNQDVLGLHPCIRCRRLRVDDPRTCCDECSQELSVPYFGRDLPVLIDVLNAYADGDGKSGCNLNTQEARKIAGILTSHVYG